MGQLYCPTDLTSLPDTRVVDDLMGGGCFRMSAGECVKQLYSPEQQRRIDFAIPQGWADEVLRLTGVYPPGLVVWSYNPEHGAAMSGAPVPTCGEGLSLLLRLSWFTPDRHQVGSRLRAYGPDGVFDERELAKRMVQG